MKTCIYAICKNEEHLVDQWYESIKMSDYIVVLDTGSSDRTADILKEKKNIKIQQKFYKNFTFDLARNDSMKLIPEDVDICIWLDFDEILCDNWYSKLEEYLRRDDDFDVLFCNQNNFVDGEFCCKLISNKIHKNNPDFYWKFPVHEELCCNYPIKYKNINFFEEDFIYINHMKLSSKSRSFYKNLVKKRYRLYKDDLGLYYMVRDVKSNYFSLKALHKKIFSIKNEEVKAACFFELAVKYFQIISKNLCKNSNSKSQRSLRKVLFFLENSINIYPDFKSPYILYASIMSQVKNYSSLYNICYRALNSCSTNTNSFDRLYRGNFEIFFEGIIDSLFYRNLKEEASHLINFLLKTFKFSETFKSKLIINNKYISANM